VLRKFAVSHFKSLADVTLTFGQANVIVGPNGSGKSNLIDCFNFVRDAALEDLDSATTKRHGADSVRQWSRSRPYDLTMSFDFESSRGYGGYRLTLASASGQFRVKEESGYWTGERIPTSAGQQVRTSNFSRQANGRVLITSTINQERLRPIVIPNYELFLSQLTGSAMTFLNMTFQSLVREIISLSTYAIYPNIMRVPQVVSREETLLNDGSNLASVLKKLNTGQRRLKTRLIEALRVVMPTVSDIQIRSAGGYYVPVLRVSEASGDTHDFNMSQLSDGTLRMIGLLAAFYQVSSPRRIALEEPEQMIHPGILPVLKDAADDYLTMGSDNQYFITTHSPNFLNLFNADDVTWLTINHGVSKASKMSGRRLALVHDQLMSAGEMLVKEGLGL
jgi:predicted ATPase